MPTPGATILASIGRESGKNHVEEKMRMMAESRGEISDVEERTCCSSRNKSNFKNEYIYVKRVARI